MWQSYLEQEKSQIPVVSHTVLQWFIYINFFGLRFADEMTFKALSEDKCEGIDINKHESEKKRQWLTILYESPRRPIHHRQSGTSNVLE